MYNKRIIFGLFTAGAFLLAGTQVLRGPQDTTPLSLAGKQSLRDSPNDNNSFNLNGSLPDIKPDPVTPRPENPAAAGADAIPVYSDNPLTAQQADAIRDIHKKLMEKMKEQDDYRKLSRELNVRSLSEITDDYGGIALPKSGHGRFKPSQYNVWEQNCHTASNDFVDAAPDKSKAGVLVCQGNPEANPAYHTANWIILPNAKTCIANWSKWCCWDSASVPPDIGYGTANKCAKWACNKQYYADRTRVMPAGKKVEKPAELVCTVIAAGFTPDSPVDNTGDFDASRQDECLACCDTRADRWNNRVLSFSYSWEQHKKDRENFRNKCKRNCYKFFR